MDLLRVTYRLDVEAAEAAARAADVALEQTVEVPRQVVRDPFVEREVMGRVEDVSPDPDGGQRATIAFPVAATAFDPAQLLNVVFGNTSLHEDARCVDVELPDALLSAFPGPRFGIEGFRKAVGVYDRPLTCTAVKPMGLSPRALAALLEDFARAGIDVIKDDHGLADHAFCPFEERVVACLEAVERAADATGHRALYTPNLIGTPDSVFRQLDFAQERGARAVMVSPMLLGLPLLFELSSRRASVPVMAHPSFGGAQRFAPELLFGKLLRLFGADAVIFLNFSGRFRVSRAACRGIGDGLTRPWGGLLPALPVPAGGITVESAAEAVEFYGRDAMLLVGGSLQVEPDGVLGRSRRFVDTVRRAGAGPGAG